MVVAVVVLDRQVLRHFQRAATDADHEGQRACRIGRAAAAHPAFHLALGIHVQVDLLVAHRIEQPGCRAVGQRRAVGCGQAVGRRAAIRTGVAGHKQRCSRGRVVAQHRALVGRPGRGGVLVAGAAHGFVHQQVLAMLAGHRDHRAVVLEGHQARQVDRGLGAVAIAVGEGRRDEHHAVIQQLR
ncbi:hypothetical protein D3C87_1623510 [compost metagenome]